MGLVRSYQQVNLAWVLPGPPSLQVLVLKTLRRMKGTSQSCRWKGGEPMGPRCRVRAQGLYQRVIQSAVGVGKGSTTRSRAASGRGPTESSPERTVGTFQADRKEGTRQAMRPAEPCV